MMALRGVLCVLCVAATGSARPNVLLLAVDDLRPHFGESFDLPQIATPNIDRLAQRSMVFQNAFCQTATCGVSRTSLLTGRRPDTTHVLGNGGCFYDTGKDWVSLPHYFRQNGYTTAGAGKIFHPGVCDGLAFGEDKKAWSLPYYHAPCPGHGSLPCVDTGGRPHGWVENTTATDNEMPDGMIASKTLTHLRNLTAASRQEGGAPFFVAMGIHKPHLPFFAPAKYFDMYPPESITLPDNATKHAPKDLPTVAWNGCSEMRSYADVRANTSGFSEFHPFPDDVTRTLRRAYYACVSFADAQIGRALAELDALGVANNTIILLFGDHGYHLGENNEFAKHTEFRRATNAPLIVSYPGMPSAGTKSKRLVEFVDIYPTLADLAGLPKLQRCGPDSTATPSCTEGASLRPVLEEPSTTAWQNASFSQWPKSSMGYSVHTERYRYTEWVGYKDYKPVWADVAGIEFYDHSVDPEENVNQANTTDPGVRAVIGQLQQQLHAGWRSTVVDA